MSLTLFTKTSKLEESIATINQLDDSKFPLLVSRILNKLHLKDEENFNGDEIEKLENSLGMNNEDIRRVLETLSFVLEQAAYYSCKPAVLTNHLEQIGLSESKCVAMTQAWTNNAKSVTEKLRQRSICPVQLKDVGWELRLQMSQKSLGKLKQPIGVVQLGLGTDGSGTETIQFEFNHQQLYQFYNQLETIQTQLDTLK